MSETIYEGDELTVGYFYGGHERGPMVQISFGPDRDYVQVTRREFEAVVDAVIIARLQMLEEEPRPE